MPERVRLSRAEATEGGHQFTTVVVCAWPRLGAGCCDVAPGCVGGRCRGGSPIRPPPPSLLLPSLLSSSPSSPFSLSLSFQSFMTWTCSWRATRSRPSRRQASAPSFLQTHLMIWFVAASRVGGERGDGGGEVGAATNEAVVAMVICRGASRAGGGRRRCTVEGRGGEREGVCALACRACPLSLCLHGRAVSSVTAGGVGGGAAPMNSVEPRRERH